MKQFWLFTIFFALVMASIYTIVAAEETVDTEIPEQTTLIDIDGDVKDDGNLVRKTRQFGFGRPFYGGGFFRPRPFYGGGFYRPRPFFGGGFFRPRPFYGGGFYRRPFYGGFYG